LLTLTTLVNINIHLKNHTFKKYFQRIY